MTIPLSLLQRAKQGHADAIAALMNEALQAQDVWVKATLDNDCLQVMLRSPARLNQQTCILFIRRGLLRLEPEVISQVRTYAWRVGEAFPLWIAEFPVHQVLVPPSQLAVEHDQPSEPPVLPTASAHLPSAHLSSAQSPVDRAVTLKPKQPESLSAPTPSKQRSELFKLGFMAVLIAMVYFVVTSV